MIQHLRNLTLN